MTALRAFFHSIGFRVLLRSPGMTTMKIPPFPRCSIVIPAFLYRHSRVSLPSFPRFPTVIPALLYRHSRAALSSFPHFSIVTPALLYRHSRTSLSSFPRRRESSRSTPRVMLSFNLLDTGFCGACPRESMDNAMTK
jgi:hypothetical protein